jgi:hypothetical protein
MGRSKIASILYFVGIIMFFTACSQEDYQYQGINIFTDSETLLSEYIPEGEVPYSSLFEVSDKVVLIGREGDMKSVAGDFNLRKEKGRVEAFSDGGILEEDLVSIYVGDDLPGIGLVHGQTLEYLKDGVPVLAVLLDGFSHEQYSILASEHRLPYFQKLYQGRALSVFTPVTNAGFASIITGELPLVNGVHDRSYRNIKVESIFGYAVDNSLSSLLLEGDIKILNTEVEPVLNIDLNNDGDTDDEIMKAAMESIDEGYDLVFIHFHGIDDRGHEFGPYHRNTLEYVEAVEDYLIELDRVWEGAIIATADHGMIETEDGGDHGPCQYEDMIVPYFLREPNL